MAKKYNEIEVQDNMKIKDENNEEVSAPKEKMKAILDVQPQRVKQNLFGRLVKGIVGEDGLPGIGSYVNEEIVKPAIKNIIVDAVTSGINMVMYGEKGNQGRGAHRPISGARNSGHRPVDYSRNFRNAPAEPERLAPRVSRSSIADYVIADRLDASNVLVSLTDAADRYDSVSVADYYDLIGAPSEYTDNNQGWSFDSISRASVIPVRGGFIIKFPPVEVI